MAKIQKNEMTFKEKKAFRKGLGFGYSLKGEKFQANKISLTPVKVVKTNSSSSKPVKFGNSATEKPVFLGPTYVNGKFYDTNWKKPAEITRELIKQLREEYDVNGQSTDAQIVDRYVNHMKRKYGKFDRNGDFIGLLGDDKVVKKDSKRGAK